MTVILYGVPWGSMHFFDNTKILFFHSYRVRSRKNYFLWVFTEDALRHEFVRKQIKALVQCAQVCVHEYNDYLPIFLTNERPSRSRRPRPPTAGDSRRTLFVYGSSCGTPPRAWAGDQSWSPGRTTSNGPCPQPVGPGPWTVVVSPVVAGLALPPRRVRRVWGPVAWTRCRRLSTAAPPGLAGEQRSAFSAGRDSRVAIWPPGPEASGRRPRSRRWRWQWQRPHRPLPPARWWPSAVRPAATAVGWCGWSRQLVCCQPRCSSSHDLRRYRWPLRWSSDFSGSSPSCYWFDCPTASADKRKFTLYTRCCIHVLLFLFRSFEVVTKCMVSLLLQAFCLRKITVLVSRRPFRVFENIISYHSDLLSAPHPYNKYSVGILIWYDRVLCD